MDLRDYKVACFCQVYMSVGITLLTQSKLCPKLYYGQTTNYRNETCDGGKSMEFGRTLWSDGIIRLIEINVNKWYMQ